MTSAANTRTRKRKWSRKNLGLTLPKSGTDALQKYQGSFTQIVEFQNFVLNMVGYIENNAVRMRELREEIEKVIPDVKEETREWKGPLEDLKKHRQFFLEVLLVRHVENYLNYLSSLLNVVFIARPEVLRSSEKIDLETVFRHASIDDLVKTVAERKVESLSYASFGDLSDYFEEKFHINLVPDRDRELVVEAIECRNISVHNRCAVNQRYLTRTGGTKFKLGEVRDLGIERIERVGLALAQSAIAIDRAAKRSLGLKGVRFIG